MDFKEEIVRYCKTLGLDLIGFIKCRKFDELSDFYIKRKEENLENEFEETSIEKRISPNYYMDDGKTIISIAFPYLHNVKYANNGFSVYTRGEDYHKVLGVYLNQICAFIESIGGKAKSFVDNNFLPERYIAYLSGIGFIGKNNMLITKKYGSYVFLGEIITNLPIECKDVREINEIKEFKECGECDICYKECPTKSINSFKKNCNICMSYITQKKEIEDKFLKLMNGRIWGCDTCQTCCPYNKDISFSNIDEFYPLKFIEDINLNSIVTLNNKNFKETFKLTSCGWRGKNTLIRNSLIKKHFIEKDNIEIYKFDSKQLQELKNRLLKIYKV